MLALGLRLLVFGDWFWVAGCRALVLVVGCCGWRRRRRRFFHPLTASQLARSANVWTFGGIWRPCRFQRFLSPGFRRAGMVPGVQSPTISRMVPLASFSRTCPLLLSTSFARCPKTVGTLPDGIRRISEAPSLVTRGQLLVQLHPHGLLVPESAELPRQRLAMACRQVRCQLIDQAACSGGSSCASPVLLLAHQAAAGALRKARVTARHGAPQTSRSAPAVAA